MPRTFLATLILSMIVGGCIRLISAERLEDGSSVMCVRVEPTPEDAGAAPSSIGPTMTYAPARAPSTASAAPPAAEGAP